MQSPFTILRPYAPMRRSILAILLVVFAIAGHSAFAQQSMFENPATDASQASSLDNSTPNFPGGTESSPSVESSVVSVDVPNSLAADPSGEASSNAKVDVTQRNDADDLPKQSTTAWAGQLLSTISSAGPMMIPILGCSILLVMFALERAITLRKSRVIPKHFVKLFLNELQEGQLKPVDALELCEENKSPISEVFGAAVKKWNRPSVEVEQAVIDEGERVANGLRRYLRLFNGIATISPLLGLLGTVLGMITAFNEIASSDAMGRPEQLANGISQALLTTAGGLSVAIPAYIVYMYFSSRVDQLIMEIDSLGQKVVNVIASDAWKGKDTRKSKKAA